MSENIHAVRLVAETAESSKMLPQATAANTML